MLTVYRVAFARTQKPYNVSFSVHTYERRFRRNFSNGARLRRTDLLNGEPHIEKVIDTIADSLSLVLARKTMRYSGEHSIMFYCLLEIVPFSAVVILKSEVIPRLF